MDNEYLFLVSHKSCYQISNGLPSFLFIIMVPSGIVHIKFIYILLFNYNLYFMNSLDNLYALNRLKIFRNIFVNDLLKCLHIKVYQPTINCKLHFTYFKMSECIVRNIKTLISFYILICRHHSV